MNALAHHRPETNFRSRVRLTALLGSAIWLTGCANLTGQALSSEEIQSQVQADRQSLGRGVAPLTGPVSLEEAIARAIKYNAAQRLRGMEEAVAQGTANVAKFDMLPKLVASAGYRYRDKDLISRSTDSVTGAPSLAHPYISSDRESTLTSLSFSWSLLDFGQSYYAARQHADRAQIAAERRRKAIHTLIQDVRIAYWRVAAAQALESSLQSAGQDADKALEDSRKVEAEKLRSPMEPLRYQRQLLENIRLLEAIQQELSSSRIELASLMGVSPAELNQPLRVIEPAASNAQRWLEQPVDKLEDRALLLNPDLRESLYNARIANEETKRVMLRMFPGLSFNYGVNKSSDSYLINDRWQDAGLQISFNLLGLLSLPAQRQLADAGVQLADQRRLATQMAVLTQLHVARLQFANAVRQYERAQTIASVDQRLSEHVNNQVQADKLNALERVSQQTTTMLSVLRRYQAQSNMQAASSRLQATLGMEPVIEGSDSMPLPELTQAVGKSLQSWDAGQFQ